MNPKHTANMPLAKNTRILQNSESIDTMQCLVSLVIPLQQIEILAFSQDKLAEKWTHEHMSQRQSVSPMFTTEGKSLFG